MTLKHAKEAALTAVLLAVLLMLYAQIEYYFRHSYGG
jgi:hypothetical protein